MLRKLRANRISLKPQGFNITVAVRQYHSLHQQRISLYTDKKERAFRLRTDLFSLSACDMGLGLAHLRLTTQMRCLHFYQSVNSPLRISLYIDGSFLFINHYFYLLRPLLRVYIPDFSTLYLTLYL